VWSGRQAQKLGLVDELGGIEDAVRYAAKRAHIEGDYRVDNPAEPRTPLERILRMLNDTEERGFSQSGLGPASELRGRLEQLLANIQALDDPRGVYARMPFDLNLR
jgi:protease-4